MASPRSKVAPRICLTKIFVNYQICLTHRATGGRQGNDGHAAAAGQGVPQDANNPHPACLNYGLTSKHFPLAGREFVGVFNHIYSHIDPRPGQEEVLVFPGFHEVGNKLGRVVHHTGH